MKIPESKFSWVFMKISFKTYVFLGDSSLPSLDPEWFRKRIALVGQEPVLFGVTIGQNIAYGREASQQEVRRSFKFDKKIIPFEVCYYKLV